MHNLPRQDAWTLFCFLLIKDDPSSLVISFDSCAPTGFHYSTAPTAIFYRKFYLAFTHLKYFDCGDADMPSDLGRAKPIYDIISLCLVRDFDPTPDEIFSTGSRAINCTPSPEYSPPARR